jgi:transposase
MPKIIRVVLEEKQRQELEEIRDHHGKPYLRERAAAILKVADGERVTKVAERGLLKRHEPETISEWIRRYRQSGVAGLVIKSGRGRKAAFFPSKRTTG